MFLIKADGTICLTRGDAANIRVTANIDANTAYTFKVDDVVRFKILRKKDCNTVELKKDVIVTEEVDSVFIALTKDDTKLGDIINKPVDYWYEVELNPETTPQTLIGYDEIGPKIFRLYPEGSDIA